ncbi:MITOTIC-SPINDLE ORGANIZING PROTEIN 1A-LIKE [Salix purpurea]|uniref:MITOTIC-SPINDLE ORGANIZING PROTEIN 1A-LIKE n=2 Tax=Salix TaxID=40685 RepID=A0A9Q0T4H0_SALPP|nr:MITOTIC-SPINDLE ORGANIZING PROTEIN 1A-LIKE [Salix purpurea]
MWRAGELSSKTCLSDIVKFATVMDPEAAKTAKESLDLAFHMSNLLNTGLDRHTLSVLIALCDLGLNPEALAAVVKELRSEPVSSSSAPIRKP